jgi:hypothetical protein
MKHYSGVGLEVSKLIDQNGKLFEFGLCKAQEVLDLRNVLLEMVKLIDEDGGIGPDLCDYVKGTVRPILDRKVEETNK